MVHVYSNVQLKFITYDSFFERYCTTIIECTVHTILVPFQYYHVVEVVDIYTGM